MLVPLLPPEYKATLKRKSGLVYSHPWHHEDPSRRTRLAAIMHNWLNMILDAGMLSLLHIGPSPGFRSRNPPAGPGQGHLCTLNHSLAGVLSACRTQVSWASRNSQRGCGMVPPVKLQVRETSIRFKSRGGENEWASVGVTPQLCIARKAPHNTVSFCLPQKALLPSWIGGTIIIFRTDSHSFLLQTVAYWG